MNYKILEKCTDQNLMSDVSFCLLFLLSITYNAYCQSSLHSHSLLLIPELNNTLQVKMKTSLLITGKDTKVEFVKLLIVLVYLDSRNIHLHCQDFSLFSKQN